MKNGFTLVEIIVTIGILGVLGMIFAGTLAENFRGQTKAITISQVRQNGQLVLDTLDRSIRAADNVVCVSADGSTVVTFNQGTYNTFRFVPPTNTTNGYLQTALTTSYTPSLCSDPLTSPATLTNTDPINGISVGGITSTSPGQFLKGASAGFKDTVTVNFTARAGVGNSVNAQETQAGADGIPFTTTIELRGR